jgi:hypothetical protein
LHNVSWYGYKRENSIFNIKIASYTKKDDMDYLWDSYKRIHNPDIYKVDLSKKLYDMQKNMYAEHKG